MNNQDKLRQWGGLGCFTLNLDMVYDLPEVTAKVLSDVIVVRAEALLAFRAMEYIGFSPHFKKMAYGTAATRYEATIKESYEDDLHDEGVKTIEVIWTEVDKS
jgi:hypothetical protein